MEVAAMRRQLNVPVKFMRITSSKSFKSCGPEYRTIRAMGAIPAQLTRSRVGPFCFSIMRNASIADCSSVTSQSTKTPPSSSASLTPEFLFTSRMAILAPAPANSRLVAPPNPDAPPVITAAIPLICIPNMPFQHTVVSARFLGG